MSEVTHQAIVEAEGPIGSPSRNRSLVIAAVYEREVAASLERVWENVYDWEHLPYLHSQAFGSIEIKAEGDWGWRAQIGTSDEHQAEVELLADRGAGHYVARTLDGAGAPSEIWTTLSPSAADRTSIVVEFCVPPRPEKSLQNLGKGLRALYTVLWDQDEEMMQGRARALSDRPRSEFRRTAPSPAISTHELGAVDEVRSQLPMTVDFAGASFRIVDVDGLWFVHSTQCPHRLGPLGECTVNEGVIACPWHGYEFDVRTGRSVDGRSLRLRSAPEISIGESDGIVRLTSARSED